MINKIPCSLKYLLLIFLMKNVLTSTLSQESRVLKAEKTNLKCNLTFFISVALVLTKEVLSFIRTG